MAKVITEARAMCPELIEAIKLFDQLAYTRDYTGVFSDFIDWLVWQHHFPLHDETTNPLSKYKKEEQEWFVSINTVIKTECLTRISLWCRQTQDEEITPSWYDPLGRMYECITSTNKSSRMGQFFTPESIVEMMVQVTFSGVDGFTRVLDPACGSGRMGIAANIHLMAKGVPSWVTMIDIDPLCAKMTAINMCLNGVVGEAVCMNGLDITGTSYRFGYTVFPLLSLIPQQQWGMYRMLGFMKTQEDVRKQYMISPVNYEHTFLKTTNDVLLAELEERSKITEESKREKAVQEIQDLVNERMKGTLFEGDASQLPLDVKRNVAKPITQIKKVKKDTNETQGSLFE